MSRLSAEDSRMQRTLRKLQRPRFDITELTASEKPDFRYRLNGLEAPSVTRIVNSIKPFLWYEQSDDARTFGTIVHAAVYLALIGDLIEDSISPRALSCVYAALLFVQDFKLKFLLRESIIGSLVPFFAGRADALFLTPDGELWLVDWKTGAIYPDTALQLAGYDLGLEQTYGIRADARMCVYLRDSGKYKRPIMYRDPADLDAFRAAHFLWSWKNNAA